MEDPRQPLGPNELDITNGPQEIEIAYILQNSQPGDRNLVHVLVDSYADEIYWLIHAILLRRLGKAPTQADVNSLVIQTFVAAITQCDRFWGEASVKKWLYKLAIKAADASDRKSKNLIPSGIAKIELEESGNDFHLQTNARSLTAGLNKLPERQYLALILHILFGLTVEEVADELGEKAKTVHEWLINLRHRLLSTDSNQIRPDKAGSQPDGEHKVNRSRTQANIDGLLEQNNKDAILLREHLMVCEACKAYDDAMVRLWKDFKKEISDGLPGEVLTKEYLEQLKQSILERLSESGRVHRLSVPFRKAAWISLLLLLFVSGMWALVRVTPEIGEFPPTATPTVRFLPTPISPGEFSLMDVGNIEEPFLGAYAMGPKISADGRWIVFASNIDHSGIDQFNNWWDILIYDAHSRTLENISQQAMHLDEGLFTFPDISGDGRWIVFNGIVDSIETGDEPCRYLNDRCSDILLYDHASSSLSRLTQGYDGSFANGPSMAPSISSNGRWIVFWSAASNLVEDGGVMCEGEGQNNDCADLYIFDRINRDIQQVAIGRSLNSEQGELGNISAAGISDDGRWLLLTIQRTDRIANEVGLQNEMDVSIFDLEERVFTPVNLAADGIVGNGFSTYAQMTPDGQYIVFQSTSDNLVSGDENEVGDIFLLDRNDNHVELLSRAPDGAAADGESGTYMGPWSEIAISSDARYVVYHSTATNLDPGSPVACKGDESSCIFIYIHDRITGITHRIKEQEENHLFLMADVSGNGRTISFVDVDIECENESGVCLDLKLYDQERAWTSEITRSLFPRDEAVWELATVLETASENVLDIEFSPDGRSIAVVEVGPLIEVISIPDGRLLRTLQGKSSSSLLNAAFSPAGEYIAGGAADGTVSIWRISDGSLAYVLDNHPGRINDLQFSDDGEFLFVATPKAVWGWGIEDKKFMRLYALDYADQVIKNIDLMSSNRLIAIAPVTEPFVWIQRISGGDVIHRLAGSGRNLSSVAFSPDNNYLLSQFNEGLTQVWRMSVDELGSITPELIEEFLLPGPLGKVAISSDSRYAAVGSSYGGLYIWEIPDGRRQRVPDSERTIYIDDVDISPSGNMLAASSRDGVHIWRNRFLTEEFEFFRKISTDEFIQIPNRRRPLQDVRTSLRIDDIVGESLNLYQADELTVLEVFAPTRLPANVYYASSSILDDGSVLTQYRVDDLSTDSPDADIFFFQQPMSEIYRPFWVGASGVIEPVEFNGRSAEYVKGNWLSLKPLESDNAAGQNSQDLFWAWDLSSEVQQLRWQHLNQLFSLIYIPREDTSYTVESISAGMVEGKIFLPPVTKDDLIEIASGISELTQSPGLQQTLIDYTITPGDTCTSIAQRYGTTVDQLIRANNMAGNCDVIIIGQTLKVPLPGEYLSLTEADLNCDGRLERLRYLPVPDFQTSNMTYGYAMDTLSDIGLYETVWYHTIAEVGAEYLIRPQLFHSNECQQLFAIHALPLSNVDKAELSIFSWDGESMELVFSTDGWLQAVSSPEEGEVSITTLKLEYLPGTSTCNRINVVYTWDEVGFNETASTTEENGSCGIR